MTAVQPLEFADGRAWESWLSAEHGRRSDAWLRIGKRNSGSGLLSISEALDGALCFGWIDAQRHGLDEVSFLQRYCPRRARSSWSKVNVAKVEALAAAGRMRPAGIAEVEAARADGRWDAAYASQREATVPADLAAALAGDDRAAAAFAQLGRTGQYALILPLLKARTAQSRARTLARTLARLAE